MKKKKKEKRGKKGEKKRVTQPHFNGIGMIMREMPVQIHFGAVIGASSANRQTEMS